MTDSTPHPTPAGQAMAEHRALHALLGEVEKASGNPATVAKDAALARRLDALRERLAAHFTHEEESGLFEQIQELAPERAHECARLCEEHSDLLRRLDDLRGVDVEDRGGDWAAGIRAFLDSLAGHEAGENEILNRVLDGSEQAQD